jgi:hypothetical protein
MLLAPLLLALCTEAELLVSGPSSSRLQRHSTTRRGFLVTSLNSSFSHVVAIHVGKTGGSSLIAALLTQSQVKRRANVSVVHQAQPAPYDPEVLYIITLRNPLRRFVSAFYFKWVSRVELGANLVLTASPQVLAFCSRYRSADSFAAALYSSSGELVVSVLDDFAKTFPNAKHINESISWYLTDFLKTVPESRPRNIVVVTQEHMVEEARSLLGLTVDQRIFSRRVPDASRSLSAVALKNLLRYYQDDFAAIERLHALGVLSAEQYRVLADQTYP